ncbi:MAG: hypothetical protein LBI38_07860 [Oscillospiraceae bacterium]|jgi:hypothetical protein|nr:hypothetical protein [Oscillospiraceae bacterium]
MSDENKEPKKIIIDDSRFDSFDFEKLKTQTTLRDTEEGKRPVFLDESLEGETVLPDEPLCDVKALFAGGIIRVEKIRELYRGDVYDKMMSAGTALILLALLNPIPLVHAALSYGGLKILAVVFALAAYAVISLTVCDLGFWIPPLAPLAAAKFFVIPLGAFDVIASLALTLIVILACLFKKDRLEKERKGELGFISVTREDFRRAEKQSKPDNPASRFNDGEFEHLMVSSLSVVDGTEPLSVSIGGGDTPPVNPNPGKLYEYDDLFIPENGSANPADSFNDGFDDE